MPGKCVPRRRTAQLRLSLPDKWGLQRKLGFQAVRRRLLALTRRAGLVERGREVAGVETEQDIPRMHALIVRDGNGLDEARDMRGDRGHVTADIGVVRRFDEPAARPPIIAIPDGPAQRCHPGRCEQKLTRPEPPPHVQGRFGLLQSLAWGATYDHSIHGPSSSCRTAIAIGRVLARQVDGKPGAGCAVRVPVGLFGQ